MLKLNKYSVLLLLIIVFTCIVFRTVVQRQVY